MPIDTAGPLSQLREQIDQNESEIAQRLTIAEANANVGGAGFGGLILAGPSALANIGASWQQLTGFTSGLLITPRDVVQNVGQNCLQFNKAGVWNIYSKVTLTFADVNNGRSIQMRLFNQTDAAEVITPITYFIGRNQDGINIIFNRLLSIPVEHLGDLLVLEISSATDAFSSVVNLNTILQATYVDLYQGF